MLNAVRNTLPLFIQNEIMHTSKTLVYHGQSFEINRFCKIQMLGVWSYNKVLLFLCNPLNSGDIALVMEKWQVQKIDPLLGTDVIIRSNDNNIVVVPLSIIDRLTRVFVGPIENECHVLVECD